MGNYKERVSKLLLTLTDNLFLKIEMLFIIIGPFAPFFLKTDGIKQAIFEEGELDTLGRGIRYVINKYSFALSIIIVALLIWVSHKINKGYTMNRKRSYHSSPYWWYWICANVLGVSACSLVNVPIYMQFRLLVRGTFKRYPVNEDLISEAKESKVEFELVNFNKSANVETVNFVISDTYPIEFKMLPPNTRNLPTIRIKRSDDKNHNRYLDKNLIQRVNSSINELPNDCTINLFTTLNPANCNGICQDSFMTARGKIKHLYVFPQKGGEGWLFKDKGKKIY